jgi:uncharacterized protein YrrD
MLEQGARKEQSMDIQLGKEVLSSDGTYLGKVDRVVVDPTTHEVVEIIVHKGFLFTTDRMIELPFIARVDEDGVVYLNVTAKRAETLPTFYEHEYVVPTVGEQHEAPYPLSGGVSGGTAGAMPLLWRSTYAGHDFKPASRSMFEPAALETGSIEIRSNLPDNTVAIDKGTDIICSDGEKCGVVLDVVYDEQRNVTEIIGQLGLFRRSTVRVPAAWIESITPDHVRISVTEEEALVTNEPILTR